MGLELKISKDPVTLTALWAGCTLLLWLCCNPKLPHAKARWASSYLALEGSRSTLPTGWAEAHHVRIVMHQLAADCPVRWSWLDTIIRIIATCQVNEPKNVGSNFSFITIISISTFPLARTRMMTVFVFLLFFPLYLSVGVITSECVWLRTSCHAPTSADVRISEKRPTWLLR